MAGHRPLTATATGRLTLMRGQVSTTPAEVQWLNQGPEVLMQYDEIKQCLGSKPPRKWKQVGEGGLLQPTCKVFFLCKLGPYLGIQHNFWSPVPTCGYILCQESCVIMVRICNAGQAKVTDLRGKNKTQHRTCLKDSKQPDVRTA